MRIKHTDVAKFMDPLHASIKMIPRVDWMNPEEKAVCVVNKVIVPTFSIVDIQDNFCESIHDGITCPRTYLNRLLDECGGAKQDVFFALKDIVLRE